MQKNAFERSRNYRATLLAITLIAGGCAHATPVTPAPVDSAQADDLMSSLLGTCEVTETQKPSEEVEEAAGLTWTFNADGTGNFNIPGGLLFGNKFKYKLEGRNVLTDGPYKAIRIDEWGKSKLKMFMYDISEVYYCTKR